MESEEHGLVIYLGNGGYPQQDMVQLLDYKGNRYTIEQLVRIIASTVKEVSNPPETTAPLEQMRAIVREEVRNVFAEEVRKMRLYGARSNT